MIKKLVWLLLICAIFVHAQEEENEFVATPTQPAVESEKKIEPPSFSFFGFDPTKMPDVPAAPKTNYYMEMAYVSLILFFIVHWFNGRKTNDDIVKGWYQHVAKTFQSNFKILGEKGSVVKETQNEYRYTAYGRNNITGFLARLKLKRRHDLFYSIIEYFSGTVDTVDIDIVLEGKMQPFVFAVVPKSEEKKYRKKAIDGKFLTYQTRLENLENLSIFSEHEDLALSFLTNEVVKILADNSDLLLKLHISDQGLISSQHRKCIRVELKLPSMEQMGRFDTILKLLLRFVDISETLKLSPTSFAKAEKARQKEVADSKKDEHEKRQERSQQLKLDKLKKEKEKMSRMSAEEQQKYEEKQKKKESKKKLGRMKVVVG